MTGFAVSFGSSDNGLDESRWAGTAAVKGPKWARMPLLTIGMLGLQIVWSVEMGYASPYLLSLGLSKSLMSLVFVAGPLSGLVMQPIVGVLADRSTSRFGRRRPYIIGGAVVCVVALLLLGFTKPFASIFGLSDAMRDKLTVALAVFSIYFIDFSINAVQATDRALLVDILPTSEQELGNAWAGRMSSIGSVAGFFVGNITLPAIFPILGRTQLQVLSVLTGILLLATHAITIASVKEKILLEGPRGKGSTAGFLSTLGEIWTNMLNLPPVILQICLVQFLSWIGWFPILFYTTLWVSEIYNRNLDSPSPASSDDTDSAGTRAGNRALLYSSIVATVAIILLPFMVVGGDSSSVARREKIREPWWKVHVISLWTFSNFIFACAMGATWFTDTVFGANIIISVTGFSWAITQWAPFALLGEAIHSSSARPTYALARDEEEDVPIPLSDRRTHLSVDDRDVAVFIGRQPDDVLDVEMAYRSARASRTNLTDEDAGESPKSPESTTISFPTTPNGVHDDGNDDILEPQAGVGDKAGIILGIHNVFVVIPQFLVTGLSAIIFAIFEPGLSVLEASAGDGTTPPEGADPNEPAGAVALAALFRRADERPFDSIGFIFRIGGISTAIATVLCWRLSKQLRRQ